jgi:hypothetical protein
MAIIKLLLASFVLASFGAFTPRNAIAQPACNRLILGQHREVCSSLISSGRLNTSQYCPYFESRPEYMWSDFPETHVSYCFSPEQRDLIWRSVARLRSSMGTSYQQCVAKYTVSGYPGKQPGAGASLIAYKGSDKNYKLYISRMDETGNFLGYAELNTVRRSRYPGYPIKLNSQRLDADRNERKWAGVIAHEMLHNWNFDHPEVIGGDLSPVVGNFVYEAGWCIMRGNADKPPGSLFLTGPSGSGYVGGPFVD